MVDGNNSMETNATNLTNATMNIISTERDKSDFNEITNDNTAVSNLTEATKYSSPQNTNNSGSTQNNSTSILHKPSFSLLLNQQLVVGTTGRGRIGSRQYSPPGRGQISTDANPGSLDTAYDMNTTMEVTTKESQGKVMQPCE